MDVYLQLIKPRITTLILLVAMAAFAIASGGSLDWRRFIIMSLLTGLLASGIFALNAYLERDTDALMGRTKGRPLPSRRLPAGQALAFGVICTVAAVVLMGARLGLVVGALGAFTFVTYVLVYTPLKRRSVLHTAIGALSGATPPLIGWASVHGTLDPGAWVLAGIMFLWQVPHFLSIESMYRDDYAKAGIRVLPVTEPTGSAAAGVMVVALGVLLPWSAAPFLVGISGTVALAGSLAAGAGFLAAGIVHLLRRTKTSARVVLRASIIYLPAVFAFLVFAGAAR